MLEELLYSALEDYKLDIIIGQGPAARTHTLDVWLRSPSSEPPRGAGLLSAPLRSRFGLLLRLEFYTHDDLNIIVKRSAEMLKNPSRQGGRKRNSAAHARNAAHRQPAAATGSRYRQVRGTGKIDLPTTNAALALLEVDAHGFDEIDRRLLLTIIQKYDGGPVGLERLPRRWPKKKMRLKRYTSRS